MTRSPTQDADGVVTLSILSDGSSVDSRVSVISASVSKRVNKIAYATLVLLDGDMPKQEFPVSDSGDFVPGAEIEIRAGYASRESTIFKGIVVRHGLRIDGANDARLVVECRDKAAGMTLWRRNANYVDMSDSDIIAKLVGDARGVAADVEPTGYRHPELVQYYCTDWDFLLSRAEANGLVVLNDDGAVSVQAPRAGEADLGVTYGVDIIEFEADLDARTRFRSVEAVSWDPARQETLSVQAAATTVTEQGNLGSAELASVLDVDRFRMQTAARVDAPSLSTWAAARQTRAALACIQGRVRFQGSELARIGGVLTLDGVGERFNGDVYVASVRHEINDGDWTTEVEFGLPDTWFAERRDLTAPPAAGLLPGVDGLQIGVVIKLAEDPEAQGRVQVSVPVLAADTEGVWARLGTPYGADGVGAFFLPEIGDEVVLGYLNGDPAQPVILGSLHSAKRKPPYELRDENDTKAIVTRSGLRLVFDEDKKETTIVTPGDNKIVLSDDRKSILIEDQNGNRGELGPDGITLSSPKDIRIDAKGKIAIRAARDVTLEGLNVDASASTAITLRGNASAELSSAGINTVKGALVKVN